MGKGVRGEMDEIKGDCEEGRRKRGRGLEEGWEGGMGGDKCGKMDEGSGWWEREMREEGSEGLGEKDEDIRMRWR